MSRTYRLDGAPATPHAYARRLEAAATRVQNGAFLRPLGLEHGDVGDGASSFAQEDPEIALASLVVVLCGAIAAGGSTWAWLDEAIAAQRTALGDRVVRS